MQHTEGTAHPVPPYPISVPLLPYRHSIPQYPTSRTAITYLSTAHPVPPYPISVPLLPYHHTPSQYRTSVLHISYRHSIPQYRRSGTEIGYGGTVMFRNKPPTYVVQNTTNKGGAYFGTSRYRRREKRRCEHGSDTA
eukprot:601963-Rhodomonas_salina.1